MMPWFPLVPHDAMVAEVMTPGLDPEDLAASRPPKPLPASEPVGSPPRSRVSEGLPGKCDEHVTEKYIDIELL